MKGNLGEKFSFFTEKLKEANGLFSDTVLEIHPAGAMFITGCKKITKYDGKEVELSFSDCRVLICGDRLGIENLVNGQISVTGKIRTVEIKND